MTFFRELVAYYTLLESGVDSGPAANGKTAYNSVNSLDNQQDKTNAFTGMAFDPHMFATNIPPSCSIYGNMVMPAARLFMVLNLNLSLVF